MLTTADKHLPVLLHETDAGLPCLVCEEDCPGLEIHFWRKICINCKCSVSDHQAPTTTDQNITQVKRGKQLDDNVKAQFECVKYSWIPPGLSASQVEEYMRLLPPEYRPVVGSVGEQYRRKLLMTQLPAHDHTPSESLSKAQAEELAEFSRLRYDMSYGVGQVRTVTSREADMFDCRTCQSPLYESQLGVFTERAGAACIWCVTCFKCDVCQEPLVDLHYFYKDGELFCGRHHAELLKPRCNACDELIMAKEYTLAEDHNWHIDHFCCWECDSPLGGQRYVTRDDHPFCILCYEELFAPPCKKCMIPIGLDSAHMVHRDNHWHATESCFFCENCQVSLTTSPFLFKFDEIFCSSACAQQFSVSQLSDDSPTVQPQIEVIEDNPVDRSRVQSILRKESTPTPPTQNGTKRKVMFDVSRDDPDTDTESDTVKRTFSEEEFEYLEKSLLENQFIDDHISPSKDTPGLNIIPTSESEESEEEDFEGSEDLESHGEEERGEYLEESKESPLSESSLSNSPLSEGDSVHFDTPEPRPVELETPTEESVSQDQNIAEEDIAESESEVDIVMTEVCDTDSQSEAVDVPVDQSELVTDVCLVDEASEGEEEREFSGTVVETEDLIESSDGEEDHVTPPETTEITGHSEVDVPSPSNRVVTSPSNEIVTSQSHDKPDTPSINIISPTETPEVSPVSVEVSLVNGDVSPDDVKLVNGSLGDNAVSPSNGDAGDIGNGDVSRDSKQEWDNPEEKENDFRPQRPRTFSDTDRQEEGAISRKLSRNKPSSASFNRILRKIDHTESLFVERPGKRLKNRPRSLSSLNSHNRPQNTLEQKEDLMSMYALTPDIADMIASVYQNQASVSSSPESQHGNSINTTTQSYPDRDESRTLGASPSPCSTDTPRLGTLRRNPSYEAAEFVMQLDVESGEEEAGGKGEEVKSPAPTETGQAKDSKPFKSPKKGIKQRLSFRKKKKDKTIASSPDETAVSPTKETVSSPTKGTVSSPPPTTNADTSLPQVDTDPLSPGEGHKRTKKACVVM